MMSMKAILTRFGLCPGAEDWPLIRDVLSAEVYQERLSQGRGNTELIKLCCVQLFSQGQKDDILAIWRAKTASLDADGAVEVQLLCGAGLETTQAYLSALSQPAAQAALARIRQCVAAGDFEEFSPPEQMAFYQAYYAAALEP